MTTTVLVTGAMGQLGKRVCALLLERGHTVIALDLENDNTRRVARELRGKLVPAFINLLDADALQRLLLEHRPSSLIHLAAIVSPPCYKNPRLARRVNVEGTRNLLNAGQALPEPPHVIDASSSAVYGSRNPHRHGERVTATTPVNPVDCYGEDKVSAERLVAESGLPWTTLRLGGIISPDAGYVGPEYFVLLRATPTDNRVHMVDARDAALAFANAVRARDAVTGKVLLIGGDESFALRQHEVQDDAMEAIGIGRLGPEAGLPGDPGDDRGWGLTDWFDTREAQQLLDFQKHSWRETLAWVAEAQGSRRYVMRVVGPLLGTLLRTFLRAQQRYERRGPYANPWLLVEQKYGRDAIAPTHFT